MQQTEQPNDRPAPSSCFFKDDGRETFLFTVNPKSLRGQCDACCTGVDWVSYFCYCDDPFTLVSRDFLEDGHVVTHVWYDKSGNCCFHITKEMQKKFTQYIFEHRVFFCDGENENEKISYEIEYLTKKGYYVFGSTRKNNDNFYLFCYAKKEIQK